MRILKTNERWFDIPNDPDGARIKIKHLSPKENAEINDKCFTQDISYKKGKAGQLDPKIKQQSNPKLFRELPVLAAVVDWTGFYDREDKEMECNSDNVLRAIHEIDGFVELVNELRKELAEDIAKEKESQVKN